MPESKPEGTADAQAEESLRRLKDASRDLKDRIEEEKKRQDLPLDSNLGDPAWEQKAKDGRFDKPDTEDDD